MTFLIICLMFCIFIGLPIFLKVKKKHKHNEDMKGMLELVQKDIDSIRKQAEKEIREAEKITNEIGRRL